MKRLKLKVCLACCTAVAALGCSSESSTSTAATKADTSASDGQSSDASAGDGTSTDTASGDTAKADTKADVVALQCAEAAGAWAVTGTCSNGGGSIPYACMKIKDCTATWETDFRDWTGTLTGADYHLKNAAGTETIDGHFDDANSGSYTFKGGSLTCDATMVRYSSTMSEQLCCDVVAQDCKNAAQVCVPMAESDSGVEVVTTGCLDAAADATTTAGAACNANALPLSCGKGLLCIKPNGAGAGGQGTCAKLCASAGDCGGSQNCVIASGAPKAGVCEAACTPLAASNTCGDGQFCGPAAVANAAGQRVMAGGCSVAGTVAPGGQCKGSGECKADSLCISGACLPLCDNAHACDSGTCTTFGLDLAVGTPAGFGFCKP